MDTKLYKASRDGNTQTLINLLQNSNIDILSQTHQKNNIIHIASKFNHESFISQAIHQYPFLVRQQNSKGDTPLHIASRFGHLNVVKLLICPSTIGQSNTQVSLSSSAGVSWSNPNGSNSVTLGSLSSSAGVTGSSLNGSDSVSLRAIESGLAEEPLWKVTNLEMDTALHQALRYRQEDVAEHLLEVDPELACSVNAAGESPLYLAAESRCNTVMRKILESDLDFSLAGPHGQNPLHPATNCSTTSVRLLLGKRSELIAQPDQHGKTALHYATEAYRLEMIKLLLEIDPSSAFVPDSEGLAPLLRASSMGWRQGLQAILEKCPESIEIRDQKGRNALHLMKMTINYPFGKNFLDILELKELINERDNEGNTALLLALKNNDHMKVRVLLGTNLVDVRAVNKKGLSALDICEHGWELSYKQQLMWHRLRKLEAPSGRQPNQSEVPLGGPSFSRIHPNTDFKQMASTFSVVAALLATVTFAAAFTIPGGYNSNPDDKNLGVAVLIKEFALKVFVLSDTFAMCSSIIAVFILIWAIIGEPDILRTLVFLSHVVLKCSLYGTLIAFMSGLYVVVAKEALWVAILVCVMGTIVPLVVSQRVIFSSAAHLRLIWDFKSWLIWDMR